MNFEQLINQVNNQATDRLNREQPSKYKAQAIPLEHQHIAAATALRAQKYFDAHILPARLELEAMDALDLQVLQYLETGAPEAREIDRQHRENKAHVRRSIGPHWDKLRTLRQGYLHEGLSTDEHRRAFGALCGRYEPMPGTRKLSDGRLDLGSVTLAHIDQALEDIRSEIEATSHRGGEGGDTCAEYVVDNEYNERRIGDSTEADCSDLEEVEWAAIDAIKARAKSRKAIWSKNWDELSQVGATSR